MFMNWIFCIFSGISCICAFYTGRGSQLAAAVTQGAQAGIKLGIALAGSLCLWTGVGKLLEKAGITGRLSRMLNPLMHRVFPGTRQDPVLSEYLSGNICANFLGLGNAATPMGIRAVQQMARRATPGHATDEMCRLIVLNTASVQLIPATVAAVRVSLGCSTPYDLLIPVWITSIFSAGIGMTAAFAFGKVWPHD